MTRFRVFLACLMVSLCMVHGGARAQVATEFSAGITAGAFPWGIAAGPDGNVWFTEFLGQRIGRITPAGVVTQFSTGITQFPNFITLGPDGNLWYTAGNRTVGRITPAGTVTEFTTGISLNSSPHGITAGPDGNLWFTEQQGNRIGRITTSGVVTEFSAGISANAKLTGITAGPDGNVWFTEQQTKKIGKITPLGVVTEYSVPHQGSPGGITTGPDGNLWYAVPSGGVIVRVTPAGVFTEFSTGMTPVYSATGIAAGPDGNLWFVDANSDRVGRITMGGVVAQISTGITAGAEPWSITTGPDGNLWFTESFGNRIGRIPPVFAAASGTPQIANVNTVFGTPLKVKVTDSAGAPLAGETVTFVANPGATSGASATFAGAGTPTDASGFTAVTATANGIGGVYTVVATHAGSGATVTFYLTNVVKTLPAGNGVTISLAGPAGATLAEITPVMPPPPPAPPGIFPYGLTGFVIEGVQPGASVGVTASFAAVSGVTYYKYQNGAYFPMPGVTITPTSATFTLVDGGVGDSDGIANGRIVDPGGIAIAGITPALTGASSRKVHGVAGTYDLPLNLASANPSTEPRSGPTHTLVFTFDMAVTGATATITEGTAVADVPTFSGNDVIVPLTGVNNQQYVTVALSNVTSAGGGAGSGSVRVGFLVGDVNGSRVVTITDLGLVNAQLAQPATSANYATDVNASGTITLADKGIANVNLTNGLPPPP